MTLSTSLAPQRYRYWQSLVFLLWRYRHYVSRKHRKESSNLSGKPPCRTHRHEIHESQIFRLWLSKQLILFFERRLRMLFLLLVFFMLPLHTVTFLFQQFYGYKFYFSIIWYNNKIISLYFNCKGEACTSVIPFSANVTLPHDGPSYRPKHVVVNVMNKWRYNPLYRYSSLRINT